MTTLTIKPRAKLLGQNGNIFNLVFIAQRSLKIANQQKNSELMWKRVRGAESYGDALNIIQEYVKIY